MSVVKLIKKFFGVYKSGRWEPKEFRVGVTSGLPSMDRATVSEQVAGAMSKGVDFIQIDVEKSNHMTKRDEEKINAMRKSQSTGFGIHGDTSMAFESAEKADYNSASRDLKKYIDVTKNIKAKYLLFHTSVNPSPVVMRGVRRTTHQFVDENGEKIEKRVYDEGKDWRKNKALNWFLDWYLRRIDIWGKLQNILGKKYGDNREKMQEELQKLKDNGKLKEFLKDEIPREEIKNILKNSIDEWDAYRIIAWIMYQNKDPIWFDICGKKDPDKMAEKDEQKLVDTVTGKYLEGHVKKVSEKLKKTGVNLVFETPDARSGLQGYHRLVSLKDIYHVIKHINHPNVSLCVDFEHVATNGLDPKKEVEDAPQGIGKYVSVFHVVSYPSPTHGHHPVERGDIYLYKLLWEIRKKGLEGGYIIYEWGGGRQEEQRWQESTRVLKQMVDYLSQRIPPTDLPPDFFGLSKGEVEIEKRVTEEHMFDPLQGALEAPELSHTWFGGKIIEKEKSPEGAKKWKQEEFR